MQTVVLSYSDWQSLLLVAVSSCDAPRVAVALPIPGIAGVRLTMTAALCKHPTSTNHVRWWTDKITSNHSVHNQHQHLLCVRNGQDHLPPCCSHSTPLSTSSWVWRCQDLHLQFCSQSTPLFATMTILILSLAHTAVGKTISLPFLHWTEYIFITQILCISIFITQHMDCFHSSSKLFSSSY